MDIYILDRFLLSIWNPLMQITCCMNGTSYFLCWLTTNALLYFFSREMNNRGTIPLQGADRFSNYAIGIHIGLQYGPTIFISLSFHPLVLLIFLLKLLSLLMELSVAMFMVSWLIVKVLCINLGTNLSYLFSTSWDLSESVNALVYRLNILKYQSRYCLIIWNDFYFYYGIDILLDDIL